MGVNNYFGHNIFNSILVSSYLLISLLRNEYPLLITSYNPILGIEFKVKTQKYETTF